MRGEVEKKTPKKYLYDVTDLTLSAVPYKIIPSNATLISKLTIIGHYSKQPELLQN